MCRRSQPTNDPLGQGFQARMPAVQTNTFCCCYCRCCCHARCVGVGRNPQKVRAWIQTVFVDKRFFSADAPLPRRSTDSTASAATAAGGLAAVGAGSSSSAASSSSSLAGGGGSMVRRSSSAREVRRCRGTCRRGTCCRGGSFCVESSLAIVNGRLLLQVRWHRSGGTGQMVLHLPCWNWAYASPCVLTLAC